MSTQRTIRRTFLAMALAALGANGAALAEPWFNDTFLEAGPFTTDDGVTAQAGGRISNDWFADRDFYYFNAEPNGTVTLDIEIPAGSELDAVVYVFDPTGKSRYRVKNTGTSDLQFTADTGGLWKVAVVAEPAVLKDGGEWVTEQAASGGMYNLSVTRSTVESLTIGIDIKPNNRQSTTPIKVGERHIRVALLSDRKKGFDPFAINVDSLTFGPNGTEASLVRCAIRGKDRNGDRKPDRVCRFDNAKAGFTLTNTVGMVKGKTRDGKAFQGVADVKVLAQKQHKDRKHHDDDDDDD